MPFRKRHIQHFRTLASIHPPRIMRAVAAILIGGLVSAALFLVFAPWVQTAAGSGMVTTLNPNDRLQDLNALVAGRIEEWYVRDGARVKAGNPIVKIVDNDPLLIERLNAERAQLIAKVDAAEAALRTASVDRDRMKSLFDDGLAARRDFEQAQIRVEDLRARVAEAAAELSRLQVSISRQSAQVVRAPREGVILRVNAGDQATFVSAGQTIATFAPTEVERAVEIFVDGRDVSLIRTGARVRLQFEGWPALQFSGWPRAAIGTFGGVVSTVDPSAAANGRFRVLVVEDLTDPHPWPDANFVRLGSAARGWVLLETVPVGYELWRQLNNFPPEFSASQISSTQGNAK